MGGLNHQKWVVYGIAIPTFDKNVNIFFVNPIPWRRARYNMRSIFGGIYKWRISNMFHGMIYLDPNVAFLRLNVGTHICTYSSYSIDMGWYGYLWYHLEILIPSLVVKYGSVVNPPWIFVMKTIPQWSQWVSVFVLSFLSASLKRSDSKGFKKDQFLQFLTKVTWSRHHLSTKTFRKFGMMIQTST